MTTHAWAEHVVCVELVSQDSQIADETARFLEQRFDALDPDARAEPGRVHLHSQPEQPVTAAQVAGALAEAGVRALAVHERQEWSVADVAPDPAPASAAHPAVTPR